MSSASSASPSIPDDRKEEEKENIDEMEDLTVYKVDDEKIKQLEKEMETLQVKFHIRGLDTKAYSNLSKLTGCPFKPIFEFYVRFQIEKQGQMPIDAVQIKLF